MYSFFLKNYLLSMYYIGTQWYLVEPYSGNCNFCFSIEVLVSSVEKSISNICMYSVGSNCFCQFEVKDFWRIAKSLVLVE